MVFKLEGDAAAQEPTVTTFLRLIKTSNTVTCEIDAGNLTQKPGWTRMSIHPTITNKEIAYVCKCIKEMAQHHTAWSKDYEYQPHSNEYLHRDYQPISNSRSEAIDSWFEF